MEGDSVLGMGRTAKLEAREQIVNVNDGLHEFTSLNIPCLIHMEIRLVDSNTINCILMKIYHVAEVSLLVKMC